jgi:hypothetical protein
MLVIVTELLEQLGVVVPPIKGRSDHFWPLFSLYSVLMYEVSFCERSTNLAKLRRIAIGDVLPEDSSAWASARS